MMVDQMLKTKRRTTRKPQRRAAGKTRGRSTQKDGRHPVDVQVGDGVRQRRRLLGMNQTALGEAVGVAFQQIQKYEKGTDRISASRLYEISRVLDIPVTYFFDETGPGRALGGGESLSLHSRETLKLVEAYYAIPDAKLRDRIHNLLKSMARADRARVD